MSARSSFIIIAWIFTGAIMLQVVLAGLATFNDPSHWGTHSSFAQYFAPLPLVMAILAWFAKLSSRMIWRSIGLFAMFVLMFITANLTSQIGVLSALHPVIALLMFWSSTVILRSIHKKE